MTGLQLVLRVLFVLRVLLQQVRDHVRVAVFMFCFSLDIPEVTFSKKK